MNNVFSHSIPESSCFFQGHKEQFFSRKVTKKYLSFRVSNIYNDPADDFNTDKYKPIFSKLINHKIVWRKQDGGSFHAISPNDLQIKSIKLCDDDEGDVCGSFSIYPATALCLKNGCNQYFELKDGRKCGHNDTDPWEQFTFLAFCDVCGRLLPLHYMTNINKNCKKCNSVGSLTKISWGTKDNIGSYKVRCNKCGNEDGLYFYECDHTVRDQNLCLSTKKKAKFRGVPARASAIVHPYVISIPDLSSDSTSSTLKGTHDEYFSAAFKLFSNIDFEESLLYLPEFKEKLGSNAEFWHLKNIKNILDEVSGDNDIDISSPLEMDPDIFVIFIKKIFRTVYNRINDGAKKDNIISTYGITYINDTLESINNIDFKEYDFQCSNLINSKTCKRKTEPMCKPIGYKELCDKFGLINIFHFPDITMIQALLGIIEGSTRHKPVLFKTINTGKNNKNEKPTVFIRKFITEGILFQLDHVKIVKWLQANNTLNSDCSSSLSEEYSFTNFRNILLNDENCKEKVKILLHTYSHMLMQQSTIDTGLDISSLSEIICPHTCSIFIYSTNSINVGGLEFTYNYHIADWFSRVKELAEDCPQDPACMLDEGGSCNSCSYVPEYVCYNFNEGIDRSSLVGGSERFDKGYLE